MKFDGNRRYPTGLYPVSYDGHHQLGLLFEAKSNWNEFTWEMMQHSAFETESNSVYPSRDMMDELVKHLNEEHRLVSPKQMKEIFVGWPNNVLEEWADEHNTFFILKFDAFYDGHTMSTIIHVRAFGKSYKGWYEYKDSYDEALTMLKLQEGLK